MKLSVLGYFAIALLFLTSCQKDDGKVNDLSDADLISAIQKSTSKQNIDISQLPSGSKATLSEEYVDDYIDLAKLAPELGYEVDLRCEKGPEVGEYRQAYFNLKGRILRGDRDKGDHGDKPDGDKGDRDKICFVFVYPVTFVMPDDTEIIIVSRDDKEGWGQIKTWYKNHPDVKERPELEFPVDIEFKGGIIKTINNREEMKKAKAWCDGAKKACFWLVYPVTYIMPDATEITVDSKDDKESWMEIRMWYKEHPDVVEKPALKFPVDIKYKDGTIVTINSMGEMREAKKECGDEDKD